jgi:serine/threonine protein kinase
MLTRRGGVCDFVKLLDFGLVKAVDSEKMRTLTAADAITGTPLYLAPETIEDGDASDKRSDLYSLGAVGYYLLTGRPVFDTGGIMEIMRAHLQKEPMAPSKRLARPMSAELERLVLRCLAKSPAERPQSAAEMALELAGCVPAQPWTQADAESWWLQYQPTLAGAPPTDVTEDVRLASTLGFTDVKPAT